MCEENASGKPLWYQARVLEVLPGGTEVRLERTQSSTAPLKSVVRDVNGEQICKLGTHINKPKADGAAARALQLSSERWVLLRLRDGRRA